MGDIKEIREKLLVYQRNEITEHHIYMYCLEGDIGPTHLQKVDSAFQALPADEAAHPGRC
jgi:hypothetical protein